MEDLMDLVTGQLGGGLLQQIGGQLGVDEGKTKGAVAMAVPLLMTALANNAEKGDGAKSLHNALGKDHDGGLLDNLSGFLGNPAAANGAGILKHVLGSRRATVENNLAKSAGIDKSAAGSLLEMLAPIVLAWLGRSQKQNGLDPSALMALLGGQKKNLESKAGGNLLGTLNSMLDSDGDGNALDDLGRMAGKLFGR